MTGPEHYREAERLIDTLDDDGAWRGDWEAAAVVVGVAKVHATLALAAAAGLRADSDQRDAWTEVAGTTEARAALVGHRAEIAKHQAWLDAGSPAWKPAESDG